MSAEPGELVAQVQAAGAARRPLHIRAGGTKEFYGNATQGERLDPRPWRGIEAYEPSELYVTARAGTPLQELEMLLEQHGQMLAFEPPHFGAAATVGGCVAAGLAGPRRCAAGVAHGALRDFVLGARLLDGRGRLLRFGGTVIKNVAGYDVARVLPGSLGILGVILEITLKVLPRPHTQKTLCLEMDEARAIEHVNRLAGRPLPLSASLWHEGQLWLRFEGARAGVHEAAARMGGESLSEQAAQAWWSAVREQQLPMWSGAAPLWRFSLPATAPPLGLEGSQIIEWQGAQRWLRTASPASVLRARARELGGHATLFRAGGRAEDVFTPLAPPLEAIQRRLQDEFDPARIFNPGRMYQEMAA